MPPAPRPAISLKLLRVCAALLETGLLVVLGTMLLEGSIQNPESEGPPPLPIHPGWGVLPIVIVALVHGYQRLVLPRRFAFVIAGAIVCATGGALQGDVGFGERIRGALAGAVVGAIVTGLAMSVDDESTALMEGGAKPWRELFLGMLLTTIGSMPSSIWGGFVLAMPTVATGLVVLGRCAWMDARIVVPRRSAGAAMRVFFALLLGLLGLGLLVVCPFISLGLLPSR